MPGSYLVKKLEIEESSDLAGDFEAFSTVSFSSFLAGYNCLQQLHINETKTNNFPILSAFQIDQIRVGQGPHWQPKLKQHYLVIRLDNLQIFFPIFLSRSGSISPSKFVPFLSVQQDNPYFNIVFKYYNKAIGMSENMGGGWSSTVVGMVW